MEEQTKYYAYRRGGEVRRIAKIVGSSAFAYEEGQWIPMQGLIRIRYDDTDFDEISEEEANKLIGEK